ncbi:MAG: 1-(5-phosphoribosyl)-5-[(5-phosphoribosylamino)methylideneamino]imidazole-4-carboxamide isomerase [Oscillospiraceae bacterium]|nr:1-(5-phosphoribosyl)-5-[(5-phosphoribosylamino)methylideneamino]imidazole-4-carboxamide isomerase [Oscillospiraceae bacterium]
MLIFPAIDIKDGRCVRLTKGDFSTVQKVADDYMETARAFEKSGSEWIHMVDLDGAKSASPQNRDIFVDVATNTSLKVQVGGGIRTLETIESYINAGITRIILGSIAIENPELVKNATKQFGAEKIVVGIDAKNGMVATNGWLETSKVDFITLAHKMVSFGVRYFVFTDIDKDGTLTGPNHEKTKQLQNEVRAFGGNVVASGGIKAIDDIKTLKTNGIYGAICGKSLYSGSLDLAEAIQIGKGV